MKPTYESYWKTVEAEVDASAEATKACFYGAAAANGFVTGPDVEFGTCFVRKGWLFLMPTAHEWRIAIEDDAEGAAFSVRFGLRPRLAYYLSLFATYGLILIIVTQMLRWPQYTGLIIVVLAVLFLLPLANAVASRWQASSLEKRLWRATAVLGPWRASRVIQRSLNQAYGSDLIIEGRDLAAASQDKSNG